MLPGSQGNSVAPGPRRGVAFSQTIAYSMSNVGICERAARACKKDSDC